MRVWAANSVNRTASVRANALPKLPRVLCLPSISIFEATPIFSLTPGPFHSEHPRLAESTHKRA